MPIRPSERARYPKDWKSVVVPRIRVRSGNRCECTGQCGRRHTGESSNDPRCGQWNGMPLDEIEGPKIVLTVMHLDHKPENCADDNLLHGCQGCHNRYDAPHRAAGLKARRMAARAAADLFACEGSHMPTKLDHAMAMLRGFAAEATCRETPSVRLIFATVQDQATAKLAIIRGMDVVDVLTAPIGSDTLVIEGVRVELCNADFGHRADAVKVTARARDALQIAGGRTLRPTDILMLREALTDLLALVKG